MEILSLSGGAVVAQGKGNPLTLAPSKDTRLSSWAPEQTARWLVDTYGPQKALNKAAAAGKTLVVKALLADFGAQADACHSEALCLAAKGGHVSVCQLLLDQPKHAARADDAHSVALREAAIGGCIKVCELLLEAASHCPGHIQRARLLACQSGHPKVAGLLNRYMYST